MCLSISFLVTFTPQRTGGTSIAQLSTLDKGSRCEVFTLNDFKIKAAACFLEKGIQKGNSPFVKTSFSVAYYANIGDLTEGRKEIFQFELAGL